MCDGLRLKTVGFGSTTLIKRPTCLQIISLKGRGRQMMPQESSCYRRGLSDWNKVPLSPPCEIQQGLSNCVDHGNEGDTEKTCVKMCTSGQQGEISSAKLTAVLIKQNVDTPDPGHSWLVSESRSSSTVVGWAPHVRRSVAGDGVKPSGWPNLVTTQWRSADIQTSSAWIRVGRRGTEHDM